MREGGGQRGRSQGKRRGGVFGGGVNVLLAGGLQRVQRHSGTLDDDVMDFVAPPPGTQTHTQSVLEVALRSVFVCVLTWTGPARSPVSP